MLVAKASVKRFVGGILPRLSRVNERGVDTCLHQPNVERGEMVGAFAAENGLATIVGTRTGSQVLGGGNFSVGHGFVLRFSAAGWYTWRGVVVEGKGVEPDVDVPQSPEGLRHGRDKQLEAATVATVEAMPGN